MAEIKKQYWDIWESRAPISIFNGDIIKNWGKVGESLHFLRSNFNKFLPIFCDFDMKNFSNLKFFFLVNQYYPRLYWSTIEKIFIPQTCRTREGFVKLVKIPIFEAENLIQLLSPCFGTQVQSKHGVQYIYIGSFDFDTKQDLCPLEFMPRFSPF